MHGQSLHGYMQIMLKDISQHHEFPKLSSINKKTLYIIDTRGGPREIREKNL
jgi:hypothetical protein